mmetsp:Transcript_33513/g.50682  ORF Transcript_33513/g.50682 Transcript_33513/m.50682 type:complete len:366 (-) Transcript_33513:239-1336(-)|eukprot:CAMPEP_0206466336 /NCGR_PEP_ID=MMETSP0324_2-20121206/28395_1 /ASSEMBLY_ACC=CAM_ASM_000836 /TAXON_ID=2866 /ORGANISM="Crypthecodinium cohnii, Strain Seligo" /LENGTH=365 /DNA_ID=CAMNT_0053939427 /DNA_START=96 /DNA_END=1193 /DNA_ORIENTATION=+
MASDEPSTKRQKTAVSKVSLDDLSKTIENTKVLAEAPASGPFICTHHGTFHADEAMACAMLKCLPDYAELPVVRTRSAADIDRATIVVDVGAVYDESKSRFDHHQKTFTETYSSDYPEIKLSSAGLVFKHFGSRVIEALCGALEAKTVAKLVSKTYDSLIRELDALDNGVSVADKPRYRFCTHLGARIGRLNPGWQEKSTPAMENERFQKAMLLAAKELSDVVSGYCESWLPARSIVEAGLSKRRELHPSGEIMKLPGFCPWQEHLFDIESEEEDARTPLVKYVLFADSRAGWRIQAVPKERGSFENRLALPKAWRGIRDKDLSELTGIPGCVFVHAAGFIGGHSTEDGAFEMAKKALEENAKTA